MQSGELSVNGKNDIRIVLDGRPHKIKVYFCDDPDDVPCNPHHHHHHDHLHFKCKERRRHEYVLEVFWETKGPRTVKWEAYF